MNHIKNLINQYQDSILKQSFSSTRIEVKDHVTELAIDLGFYLPQQAIDQLIARISDYFYQNDVSEAFEITIKNVIKPHKTQAGLRPLKGIKNIIAIASGKGGVGKSTTAANLAITMAKMGAKAGLLDADIYGPSQPLIMGSYQNPTTNDKKKIEPLVLHGVKMISVGNLIDKDSAIIWRGPMVSGALMQLLNDTNWDGVDYLIIDLPPGTGDIQLTMSKKIPITTSVIVTTPQDLSLIDAKRAIAMFSKVGINVAGIVENMSVHVCEKCGHESHVFGQLKDQFISHQETLRILGALPLDINIRQDADAGCPTVAKKNSDEISVCYETIAIKLMQHISQLDKSLTINMPGAKVEYSQS